MKYFNFPNTDLNGSIISLGCMTLGGSWNDDPPEEDTIEHAVNVIRTALDEGINFFDHADIYTRGKSEIVFSRIFSEIPGLRDKIYLQSKCGIRFPDDSYKGAPHRYDFSYEHIIKSAETSLERLKTDYLDVLLLHRPDPLIEPQEVARAFDELKASGKVRYFGVSNHTAYQMELLRKYVNQPIIFNQIEFNVVHTDLLDEGIGFNQRRPERPIRNNGTIEYCRMHDITLQAWSPIAKGKLTGNKSIPEEERFSKTREILYSLAADKNVSPETILVAWILKHPAGIQPIVGTKNPERIKAVCKAAEIDLSREEWYLLFTAGRGESLP